MLKYIVSALLMAGVFLNSSLSLAQKYVSTESVVSFFSEAPLENIKATNKKSASIFNLQTQEVAFSVPVSEFQFEKKLMQQHFNERYMETDKFPRATFAGKVEGFNGSITDIQSVHVIGKLTIHGVSREVTIPGTLQLQNQTAVAKAKFKVALADHKIEVPKLLWENIAEVIEVTVDFKYKAQ